MLAAVFFWGSAVLLFKCPEKAGIIFKSVLVVDLPDGLSGQNGIFAGMKTLFQYILVKRDAHIILEYMGNMKFAYVEKGSQAAQAQIFLQMPVDVIADVQVQKIFIYCGPLMDHIIYYPVHIDEKRNGHELRGLPLEGPAAAQFFQKIHELSLQCLGGGGICMEAVSPAGCRLVKAVGELLVNGAEFIVVVFSEPKDKPAVGLFAGEKHRVMGRARRDKQTVSVFQMIQFILDMVVHISFQKKIQFIVIMVMGGHAGQSGVALIKKFKIVW